MYKVALGYDNEFQLLHVMEQLGINVRVADLSPWICKALTQFSERFSVIQNVQSWPFELQVAIIFCQLGGLKQCECILLKDAMHCQESNSLLYRYEPNTLTTNPCLQNLVLQACGL